MNEQAILIFALCFIFYHISGLATTNILRLTAGNSLPVLSATCQCDSCHTAIPPLLQLPILSYLLCEGKCKNCGARIPLFPLLLEVTVFGGMCLVAALLRFSPTGITGSFLFYEAARLVTVLLKGKREAQFAKQYAIAALSMLPFYLLTQFVALLYVYV